MNATIVAVDLAKNIFELAIADADWRVAQRQRLTRLNFLGFFVQLAPCQVVMEACGSAHKTVEAQQIQSLHRLRSQWMSTRQRYGNTLRGILREFGFAIPLGVTVAKDRIGAALALRAVLGDIQRFPSGRHFASWLGLTPNERTSADVDSERSPNKAMCICARCSFMALDLFCSRHIALNVPHILSIGCAAGRSTVNVNAVTTRPPSHSLIDSPESSGRPWNMSDPSMAIGRWQRNR